MTALLPFAFVVPTGRPGPAFHHSTPTLQAKRNVAPSAVAVPASLAPVAGLAMLTAVVVVHEAGHFLAAKGPSTRRSERLARLGRPNPPVDEQVTHELAALRNRISPSMS